MAKEVWADENTDENAGKKAHEAEMVFPVGAPNDAYAKYLSARATWRLYPQNR